MFVDLRRSDTGVYTCRAVSETGETARGAALTVDSPTNPEVIFHRTPEPSTFPGSPAKPSVTDVTDSSVLLSWRPSSTHGASPVFAYTVEYFSQNAEVQKSSIRCHLANRGFLSISSTRLCHVSKTEPLELLEHVSPRKDDPSLTSTQGMQTMTFINKKCKPFTSTESRIQQGRSS